MGFFYILIQKRTKMTSHLLNHSPSPVPQCLVGVHIAHRSLDNIYKKICRTNHRVNSCLMAVLFAIFFPCPFSCLDLHAVLALQEPGTDMAWDQFIVLATSKAWTTVKLHSNVFLVFENIWFTSKHGKVWSIVWTDVYNGESTSWSQQTLGFSENSCASQIWGLVEAVPKK